MEHKLELSWKIDLIKFLTGPQLFVFLAPQDGSGIFLKAYYINFSNHHTAEFVQQHSISCTTLWSDFPEASVWI